MERPLTKNIQPGRAPLDAAGYQAAGGYQAARQALQSKTPAEVVELVKQSGLRGRGGAGFGTGLKWSFVPQGPDSPNPKYLVVNADEMEPGTFKDRVLLEGDPHLLIEGVLLAAYAIQASVSYVFIRGEYREAAAQVARAIAEAEQAGLLGRNILGSGFDLEVLVHLSGGRYMCGEETGLLNALEGKRANPRAKPPFPQVSGLWGKPTIVQNVETLCNLPGIVERGADWFKKLSLTDEGGTKLYGVSGRVKRPGIWELPVGTPMRELVEEHAGGMQDGLRFRAALPGGASTGFLVEEQLDTPMDTASVAKAGSRMGTGTMIVLDDGTCPVGFVHNLEKFFARESCGWCTPCREGLPFVEQTLEAIERGQGRSEDIQILERHVKYLGPGMTFCALAPGAMDPLQSALKYFRADFEKHFSGKACPWRQ
jgi:NADH-quinone oxidoreductase subunit F